MNFLETIVVMLIIGELALIGLGLRLYYKLFIVEKVVESILKNSKTIGKAIKEGIEQEIGKTEGNKVPKKESYYG
jgi:hypothetical protein